MRIFITGATGYLGRSIAAGLRRAGHHVAGLARTEAKARSLAAEEIEPVLGSMERPESYRAAAAGCSVAVHAAVDYSADVFGLDRLTVETLLSAGPELLVYTSGVWVYGSTGRAAVDEASPINPPSRVSRRPEIEGLALGSASVRGIVIRPGCVYGGRGGMMGDWFAAAARGEAPTVVGDGDNHWSLIHLADLADGYLRAVESNLSDEIINLTDRSRESVTEMATAAAAAAGFRGPLRHQPLSEATKTLGSFAECLALDQHVDSSKAVRRLGWQPRHGGFADRAQTFFRAWQASQ